MQEEWLNITGYEGLYQVSNTGKVKSLNYKHTGKEHILKAGNDGKGYQLVNLWSVGNPKSMKVHRLVAQAFIPNPDNLPQVNHIDENPSNNNVENLEWCTAEYNSNYGTRNERMAKTLTNNTKKSKPVKCIETNIIFPSAMEIQRKLGFAQASISNCCNGKLKSAYGFHWVWA